MEGGLITTFNPQNTPVEELLFPFYRGETRGPKMLGKIPPNQEARQRQGWVI